MCLLDPLGYPQKYPFDKTISVPLGRKGDKDEHLSSSAGATDHSFFTRNPSSLTQPLPSPSPTPTAPIHTDQGQSSYKKEEQQTLKVTGSHGFF